MVGERVVECLRVVDVDPFRDEGGIQFNAESSGGSGYSVEFPDLGNLDHFFQAFFIKITSDHDVVVTSCPVDFEVNRE